MKEKFKGLYEELRGGLFLSSMMGITDGTFCGERSRGCKMVQLGAYLAEPPKYGEEEYFLPPSPDECERFFKKECEKIRCFENVFLCLNLATPRLEWGLEAAECFYRAGGDFVELNAHGDYEPYLQQGKLMAMALPENRGELLRWVGAFTELDVPLIVKFWRGLMDDYSGVLEDISDFDVFGVHFDVRDEEKKKPDFKFVRKVDRDVAFLLVSGYVRNVDDARILFEAGADMVGIAEPTIKDRKYIDKIRRLLNKRSD